MKRLKKLTYILIFSLFLIPLQINAQSQYLVGYGKTDITFTKENIGLFGYGDYHHNTDCDKTDGCSSRIYSRVVSIKDPISGKQFIYLHADLGAIFTSLREGLVARIKQELYPDFDESALMMTASHTHCAPSGMSKYGVYMAPTPGYRPELVAFTIDKMYESVVQAAQAESLCTLEVKEGVFAPEVPVAFNRALKSYNKNKDIETKFKREESNLALNRNMPLLSFVDENGQSRGFINWFGVHPIELLNDHNFINGASKGYAATYAEEEMGHNDVAIFAQGAAGDVMTSDYHNVTSFEHKMQEILNDSSYSHLKSSLKQAKWNGKTQAAKALEIQAQQEHLKVGGSIDHELIYIDMGNVLVAEEYAQGRKNARTTDPVLGAAFFSGQFYWKDMNMTRRGLNLFANMSKVLYKIRSPFINAEQRQYKKTLYRSHSPKKIVLNGGEKSIVGLKFEDYHKKGFTKFFLNKITSKDIVIKELIREVGDSALIENTILPQIVPIQIVKIGNIAIVGIPTEITTVAHNRLQKTLEETLKSADIEAVFISSYANEYAGYTTTFEEYMAQRYEGGHTLFGKHQLGAFLTEFKKLAMELMKPEAERTLDKALKPPVFSTDELEKRSNLTPLVEE